jgi:tetratricopeptide (TPR) repeat protein
MDDRPHTRVRQGPSCGRRHDAPTTGRRASARRPYGVLLVVLGLLADSSAGLMILVNQDGRGLLVHVPAALVWALGISVLNGRLPWRAPGLAFGVRSLAFGSSPAYTPNAERHAVQADPAYLNRWLLTSVLLGLVLFPGLGPLGCTIGFGLAHLLDQGPQQNPGVGDQREAPDLAVRLDQRVDPLRDLQIQPLVDILRQPNSELKRAAIELLGRQGSHEAMRLVREALTDPDPDVRSDAAVTLSRFEDNVNRALSQAVAQGLDSPHSAERYADLCYRYATSALVDVATSRYYLTQARDTLRRITALRPERADVWLDLARVHYHLGEEAAAWQALDRARTLHPANVASYLLGMEMAFDARDWDRLAAYAHQGWLAYAHQGWLAAGDEHEDRELVRWWAQAQPLSARRADRSTP